MLNEEMIKALSGLGYQYGREVGVGGQGSVHHVRTSNGESQAIKVKHFALCPDVFDLSRSMIHLKRLDYHSGGRITYSDGITDGEATLTPQQLFFLQRDISERTGLIGAQGTANVLKFLKHYFFKQGHSFGSIISTEYLEGKSLSHSFKSGDELDPGIRNLIIHNMGVTLKSILNKGIIHGDLKPGNVFLGDDNSVKLLDFGSARLLRGYNFMEGTPEDVPILLEERLNSLASTPGFCSPEAARSEGLLYSPQSEYFAYGVLAVATLSDGKSPFVNHDFENPLSIAIRISEYSDSSWDEHIEPKLNNCPTDLKEAIKMAMRPNSKERQIDPLIEVSGEYAYGHLSHSNSKLVSTISDIRVPRLYEATEVEKFERKLGGVALSCALMGAAALYGPSVVDLVNNWF